MAWGNHHETAATEKVKDLKLAASFVKSIETEHHDINIEIQQLARDIERLAVQLREGRNAAGPAPHR